MGLMTTKLRGSYRFFMFATLLFGLSLTGCTVLDALTGVSPDRNGDGIPESDGSGGIAGTIGSLGGSLPGLFGLAGTILGAGATLYQRMRSKKYLAAAKATVRGIDKALDKGTSLKISKEELYSALLSERAGDKYSEFIKDLVSALKKERREE